MCVGGTGWRSHIPLTCLSPAEMDFAKGLQKIVHNCRQSVMQEVGLCGLRGQWAWSLGPGWESRPTDRGQREGFPTSTLAVLTAATGARQVAGLSPCSSPTPEATGPPPQPHMPLLSIYSLALEQDLEFGHSLVQAVGTLQTQTFIQVGGLCPRGVGEWGARIPLTAHLAPASEPKAAGA